MRRNRAITMVTTPRELFALVDHLKSQKIEEDQRAYDESVRQEIERKRDKGVFIMDNGLAHWPPDCVDTDEGPMDEHYILANIILEEDTCLIIDDCKYSTEGLPEDGLYILGENGTLFGPFAADEEPRRIKPIARRHQLRRVA